MGAAEDHCRKCGKPWVVLGEEFSDIEGTYTLQDANGNEMVKPKEGFLSQLAVRFAVKMSFDRHYEHGAWRTRGSRMRVTCTDKLGETRASTFGADSNRNTWVSETGNHIMV